MTASIHLTGEGGGGGGGAQAPCAPPPPLRPPLSRARKETDAERERYHADPDPVRYGKAKRSSVQNQRGHRKSTTDKVIQRYVNVVTFSYLRY